MSTILLIAIILLAQFFTYRREKSKRVCPNIWHSFKGETPKSGRPIVVYNYNKVWNTWVVSYKGEIKIQYYDDTWKLISEYSGDWIWCYEENLREHALFTSNMF